MNDYIKKYFPYEEPREEQITAINFALDTFLKDDKKFCIVEAGTGVGKSAVGLVLGRILNAKIRHHEDGFEGGKIGRASCRERV